MRPRYFYTALLFGAFFGTLLAAGSLTAQTDQHEHEGEFHTCGFDWARQLDHKTILENTRRNNPEVYAKIVAREKEGIQGRAVLAGASAMDEIPWEFFVVDRKTLDYVVVNAVSKYIDPEEKLIIWVDVRDTASIRQSTIDRLVEGLLHNVKPGPNTRDPNKGVIQNDIDIFGEPPTADQFGVKVNLFLLNIDDGNLTGGILSGYFFGLDQNHAARGSNKMNLLYIDSPQLYGASPDTRSIENVLGTVAHEFQHLINHRHYTDQINDETHYLYNEGLSEVASLRNGYSDRNASQFLGSPNRFAFFDAPFGATSGDTILPAYERGMMMTHYLSEQYGDAFLNRLVAASGAQIEPIQWALQQVQSNHDARDVWTNFWVANYLQNQENPQGDPRYQYKYAVAGRSANSFSMFFPTSGPRTDEMIIKGYTAFLPRYGNPDTAGAGLKVRFHPNSREYRAHVVLFRRNNTIVDVRPLTIDQEYTFEHFSSAVFIVNSLDGGDQNFQWTVEGTTLGVDDYSSEAGMLAVTGVVPNPVRDEVRFGFRTAQAGDVTLELFDIRGEMVARPLNGQRYEGGEHSIVIDVADLPPGVYTARMLDGSGAVAARQIVVVK